MKIMLHHERWNTLKLKSVQILLNEKKYLNFKSEFNEDLTKPKISAGIPFWKLKNLSFNSYLKKWIWQNVASELLLRKVHIKEWFKEKVNFIKNKIKGKNIWVSIDETTDTCGRYIGYFIIDILSDIKEEFKSFLINSNSFKVTNYIIIVRFFEDTIAFHVIDKN